MTFLVHTPHSKRARGWGKMQYKCEEGFTGHEAAIVLIAFVVVAAVFSYVVLGARFFTYRRPPSPRFTRV